MTAPDPKAVGSAHLDPATLDPATLDPATLDPVLTNRSAATDEPQQPRYDWSEFVHRYLDGSLTPSETAELSQRLVSDSALADRFVNAAELDAQLAEHFDEQAGLREALVEFGHLSRTVQAGPKTPDAIATPVEIPGIHTHHARAHPEERHRRNVPTHFVMGTGEPETATHWKFPGSRDGAWLLSRPHWSAGLAAAAVLATVMGWWLDPFGLASNLHRWNVASPNLDDSGYHHSDTDPRREPAFLLAGTVRLPAVPDLRVNPAALPLGHVLETVGAEPAVVALSDGSQVELDPDSAVVLWGAVGSARQVVELLRGTAGFQVAPGNGRFRVDTPVGPVTVLGTRFRLALTQLSRADIASTFPPSSAVLIPPPYSEGEPMQKDPAHTGPLGLSRLLTVLTVTVLSGTVRVELAERDVILFGGQSQVFAENDQPRPKPALKGNGEREMPRPKGDRDMPRPKGDGDMPRPKGDRDMPRPKGDGDMPRPKGDGDHETPRPDLVGRLTAVSNDKSTMQIQVLPPPPREGDRPRPMGDGDRMVIKPEPSNPLVRLQAVTVKITPATRLIGNVRPGVGSIVEVWLNQENRDAANAIRVLPRDGERARRDGERPPNKGEFKAEPKGDR